MFDQHLKALLISQKYFNPGNPQGQGFILLLLHHLLHIVIGQPADA